jgi:hypothetical protein
MKRTLILVTLLLSQTCALSQAPVIRASLNPSRNVVVGQPIRLQVTLLVPNYFTGSPDFPTFSIDNAIVIEPQDRPQNLNDTIGGIRYAGISQTYTIYTQVPGDFKLPPIQFTVPYASNPPKTTISHLSLPPLTFRAEIPAAAQDLPYFLPTSNLTLQQKWDSPLKEIRVGDTLSRTITVTTTRTQGMMIPPLTFSAPDGIRLYPEQPKVIDQKTPTGEFIYGRRTESVRYFLQKAGDYTLPPIEISWWNLNTNKLVTAALPPVHLSIAENPGYLNELPPTPEPAPVVQPVRESLWRRYGPWLKIGAPILVGALLLVWLIWRYLPRIYRHIATRLELRRQSEDAIFQGLIRACRRNDPVESYRRLLAWTSVRSETSLDRFLRRTHSQELISEVENLGKSLYSKSNAQVWDGHRLASLLIAQQRTQKKRRPTVNDLTALNPGSSGLTSVRR